MEDRIIFNIDVMLAKRKMSVTRLSEEVGITIANLSVLKNGKARALLGLCTAFGEKSEVSSRAVGAWKRG